MELETDSTSYLRLNQEETLGVDLDGLEMFLGDYEVCKGEEPFPLQGWDLARTFNIDGVILVYTSSFEGSGMLFIGEPKARKKLRRRLGDYLGLS